MAFVCHCGQRFSTSHGLVVHKGKCLVEVRFQERPQVPRLPTMSPESLDADLPAMDVDPPSEAAVVSADSSSDAGSAYEPPAAGFGSATDLALAELYSKHPDIGKGVFDSIIRITKLGPSSLPSGREFFKKVDAFPGMYVYIKFYFLWFLLIHRKCRIGVYHKHGHMRRSRIHVLASQPAWHCWIVAATRREGVGDPHNSAHRICVAHLNTMAWPGIPGSPAQVCSCSRQLGKGSAASTHLFFGYVLHACHEPSLV